MRLAGRNRWPATRMLNRSRSPWTSLGAPADRWAATI